MLRSITPPFAAALLLLLTTPHVMALTEPTAAAAEAAIAAARVAVKQAIAQGAAWRDTVKMIKQAKGLRQTEQFEEAIELAARAQRQAELALRQQQQQANAGQRLERGL